MIQCTFKYAESLMIVDYIISGNIFISYYGLFKLVKHSNLTLSIILNNLIKACGRVTSQIEICTLPSAQALSFKQTKVYLHKPWYSISIIEDDDL